LCSLIALGMGMADFRDLFRHNAQLSDCTVL